MPKNKIYVIEFIEHIIKEKEVVDGELFLGAVLRGDNSVLIEDTPLYNLKETRLVGRLAANFDVRSYIKKIDYVAAALGTTNFYFYNRKSWITASFGFNDLVEEVQTPGVLLGGTNKYEGITGIVISRVISEDDPQYDPDLVKIYWRITYSKKDDQ